MKRSLRRFLYFLLLVIIVFTGYAFISGKTWMFKELAYNFADIDDYTIFTNNTVAVGTPQPWHLSGRFNKPVLPDTLKNLLAQIKSIGVTVIKNDSLLFEQYWDGYGDTSYSGSFSMAKSLTSLLVGAAVKEGKIKSLEEPVGNYLPEFATAEKAKVRIIDLLTMSSGSNWDESYVNPFSIPQRSIMGMMLIKRLPVSTLSGHPEPFININQAIPNCWDSLLKKRPGSRSALMHQPNYGSPWVQNILLYGVPTKPVVMKKPIAVLIQMQKTLPG